MNGIDDEKASRLLHLLDTMNREIMQRNEYELGVSDAKVDFEYVGQFPQRLSSLLGALRTGFAQVDSIDLLASTFLILPYQKDSASGKGTTRPLLFIWTPEKGALQCPPVDAIDDEEACEQALSLAFETAHEGQDFYAFQIPYFVRPFTPSGLENFSVDETIYKTPVIIKDRTDSQWVNDHTISTYVQRFLFTFVYKGDSEALQSVLLANGGVYVNHILGAFFSWVGITADDVSRFQTKRIASFQLLRAHQLGNDLKALFQFGNSATKIVKEASESPTVQDLQNIKDLFDTWDTTISKLYQDVAVYSQVAGTLSERKMAFNWYAEFTWRLQSLGECHATPDHFQIEGGAWKTASLFDLSEVGEEAREANIFYTRYHFDELIDNLFKNAKRAWESTGRSDTQKFRITAQVVSSHLNFAFANEGGEIPESIGAKLFRAPVPPQISVSGGNGTGLWALGMSLETFGIPLPTVTHSKDFGPCFVFQFPIETEV